jgi:serine protease Do
MQQQRSRPVSARAAVAILAALFVLAAASPAQAQRSPRRPNREAAKVSEGVKSAFRDAVAPAGRSTVVVKAAGKEVALGTVVADDGWIVTKASELAGDDITCAAADRGDLKAKLVGVATKHDLAMLKVDATDLTPVEWGDASKAEVGQWVAACGASDVPVAVGVVSVGRRKIPGRSGMIGVALADADDAGAKVAQVIPESPAEKAGLLVDDVITSVDGKPTSSREDLIALIREHSPGQQVTLAVRRGEKRFTAKVKLAGRIGEPSRAETMNQMGGPLSARSANFPAVLQHDTILAANQCGGPLVRLAGKAVGVNIARAGRVETYALPADVVISLLDDLKAGKYAPVTQPAEGEDGTDAKSERE